MPHTLMKPDRRIAPVLKPTRHEKAVSGMMCAVVALTLLLSALMLAQIPDTGEPTRPIPIVLVELPPGEESEAEPALELESPSVAVLDPQIAEDQENPSGLAEVLETVIGLSDDASENVEWTLDPDPTAVRPTPRKVRRLGPGPVEGPFTREERWWIGFNVSTIDDYIRQLEYFDIKLGALLPDGRVVMMHTLSKDKPETRTLKSGESGNRFYSSPLVKGKPAQALFAKAGVDASDATILHFYNESLERELARIEVAYRGTPVINIRRTYFRVQQDGSGYKFAVSSQSYLR